MTDRGNGPGRVIASRFRLEDLLDEHSGARLWRATDLTLARNVAVHVIGADEPRATAVLTAARTSATVSEGRILRVLDALVEDDGIYVVHEWGSGMSLDRMLDEGATLEPRRAAWLVREVAEAVAVAHRHGIAHGRLLPENVMVTDAGSVKLIGFVVDAVLHGRHPRLGDDRVPPSEHESDVLNLGALLYASLTGRWPGFPQSLLPDAPLDHGRVCRPRQVRQGIPKPLDRLCEAILNPESDQAAYESAVQISSALSDYLGDTTGPAVTLGPTAFLDPHRMVGPTGPGSLGTYDGSQAGLGSGAPPRDPEPTQASLPSVGREDAPASGPPTADGARAVRPADHDPEATGEHPAPQPRPGHRRPARPVPSTPHRSGVGEVPSHWGPDPVDADERWSSEPDDERPGSLWLRLGAAVALLTIVVLAVVIAFSLGGRGGDLPDQPTGSPTTAAPGSPSPSQTPADLEVVSASDFDPDDDGGSGENPGQVPLALDGDPQTAWETKTYFDGPVLAPYRSGVGLLLDLGEEQDVSDVVVDLVGGPYDLQLLAAPGGSSAPSGTQGLATVTTKAGVSGQVSLAGDQAVRTRFLVVWLTALPPADGGFHGRIAEVVVRS